MLDLCAAPGGKATALGAALGGQGLLVANDISNSRARALLRNLELFGISNAFVTSETPAKLAEVFPRIFRQDSGGRALFGRGNVPEGSGGDENLGGPGARSILPGCSGRLSGRRSGCCAPAERCCIPTCTFSREENEGTISWLLKEFPEMELLPMEGYEGFDGGRPQWGDGNSALARCVRIWPHKMDGEGHFSGAAGKNGRRQRMEPERQLRRPFSGWIKRAGSCWKNFSGEAIFSLCGTG